MELIHFSDEHFMKEALKEAQKALLKDEVPVGAVIVCKNKIIARSHKLTETLNDVTAHTEMQAKYDAKNPAALKRLVSAGAKLHQFDKSILKAAYDAAMALYSDLSAKNPAWKKVYEDYAAFRDDQVLWFRFAEAGFDNFMQTGRSDPAKAASKKK